MGAAREKRIVVAVAPNGGRRTKEDHPALPLTADELAQTAAECLERGASMIHLHVRDAEGAHVLDPDAYRTAIGAICEAVGDRLVVQITSESVGRYSPLQQQEAIFRTNPEAASVALREMAPDRSHDKTFSEFLHTLKKMRIWPQIVLYSPEDAVRLAAMEKQGLIPFERVAVLFVLGRYTLLRTAAPSDLLPFLAPDAPRFGSWSVCAFGRAETACVMAGALLGGHARVGFENNFFLPNGDRAHSNADLVGAAVEALDALGMQPQTADGLREDIAALMT